MVVLLLPFVEAYLAVGQKLVDFEGKSETQKAMLGILMQSLKSSYFAETLLAYETQNEATLKNAFLAFGELGLVKSAKAKPQSGARKRAELDQLTALLQECHAATRDASILVPEQLLFDFFTIHVPQTVCTHDGRDVKQRAIELIVGDDVVEIL